VSDDDMGKGLKGSAQCLLEREKGLPGGERCFAFGSRGVQHKSEEGGSCCSQREDRPRTARKSYHNAGKKGGGTLQKIPHYFWTRGKNTQQGGEKKKGCAHLSTRVKIWGKRGREGGSTTCIPGQRAEFFVLL